MITKIIILLIAFQIKHYLCDFPLQTKYMLGKFKEKDWIKPLSAHCRMHTFFTLAIIIIYGFINPSTSTWVLLLAPFDFIMHFIMDRIKASPKIWGKYTPDQQAFWNHIGIDQAFHHLTHYVIIFTLVLKG